MPSFNLIVTMKPKKKKKVHCLVTLDLSVVTMVKCVHF